MRKKTTALALAAAAASLATVGANAANFTVLSTSTLNDVRMIGAGNIMNLADYDASTCLGGTVASCTGTLDSRNPANWGYMDKTIATTPDVAVELNNINVSGTLSLSGGSVTAAVLNQLAALSWGTYQSATVTSDLVAGGAGDNPMVWTYNPVNNQLRHQSGGGTLATTADISTCVVVQGTETGSCKMFSAAVNADGQYGQGTNPANRPANSIFSWDGVAANFIVRDNQTTPWHAATGTASAGGLYISGAAGLAGVTWDLNGCTEASLSCTIYARVTGTQLNNGAANSTATSALYTLQLQNVVPVPGAVWLFGSALGLMGLARRRLAA